MQDSDTDPTYREMSVMRDKHRALEAKEHRLKLAIAGFMAYSSISHLISAGLGYSTSPIDAGFAVFFAALFGFAFYRVWFKDDSRWWPVAIPSGMVILISSLAAFVSPLAIIPVLLHSFVLVLVYIRKKCIIAVANSSFKRTAAPNVE
jgi:hypothetical protein